LGGSVNPSRYIGKNPQSAIPWFFFSIYFIILPVMPKLVKIIILTEHFYPDIAATGQLLTELAFALRERGCEVVVFTAKPGYAAKNDVKRFEEYHDIRIIRCFRTRFNKNGLLGRAFNTITFLCTVFFRLLFRESSVPLLIVSNPPLLPLVGYLLNRLRGQPYVSLVHDVLPDKVVVMGYLRPASLITRTWNAINRVILKHAAQVIALSEMMRDVLLTKMPMNGTTASHRVTVIHNWADDTFIRPMPKGENRFASAQKLTNRFVVLYSGNIGLSYDFDTVLETAARLQETSILFLFIGEGGQKSRLMDIVQKRRLTNVRFMPYLPWDELPFSLTAADVSLITIEKGLNGLAMPSKLYAIMASGRPIIAIVDDNSDTAQIIREAECGIIVPQDRLDAQARVDAMVDALMQYYTSPELCQRMGANGRRFFEQHFTLRRAADQYYSLFEQLSGHFVK
jgi:glycosyltransferase involved in cell wall biosynthesis